MEEQCVQVFFKILNIYMHTEIKRTLTKRRIVYKYVFITFLLTFNLANYTPNLNFITCAIYLGLFKYR